MDVDICTCQVMCKEIARRELREGSKYSEVGGGPGGEGSGQTDRQIDKKAALDAHTECFSFATKRPIAA